MRKSPPLRHTQTSVRKSGGTTVPYNFKKTNQLQIDLPLDVESFNFQSLDFKPPYKEGFDPGPTKKKKFNFEASEYDGVPGLMVIAKGKKLVRINSSKTDIHRAFRQNIIFRNGHAVNYTYCLIKAPIDLQKAIEQKIKKSYNHILISDTYRKVVSLLDLGEKIPKKFFKFVFPYLKNGNDRIRTLSVFKNRPGIYLIKRKNTISYIGMSEKCITERCYKHLTKMNPDSNPGQINYSEDLEQGVKFKICFIEFPRTYIENGKIHVYTKEQIVVLCKKYEKILITQFDPPDNKRGRLEPEEVILTDAEIAERQKWKGDEPPF